MKELEWNLSTLIAGEEEYKTKIEKTKVKLSQLEKYKTESLTKNSLLTFLQETEKTKEEANKILIYGSLCYYKNINDSKANSLKTQAEEFYNEVTSNLNKLNSIILSLSEDTIKQYLKENPDLKQYEFYLDNLFRLQKHQNKDSDNQKIKENKNAINKQITTYNSLVQNMKYKDIKENQKTIKLTPINYNKFLSSRTKEVRKEAYFSINESYKEKQEEFATILDTIYGYRIENSKLENYSSVLEKILFEENIDKSVIKTLIHSVNKNIPLIEEYFEIKKEVLKESVLNIYDLNIPLDTSLGKTYTLEESIKIIKEALQPLGKKYLKAVDFLLDGHIDAIADKNKYQALTFSWHTYSFLNFKGSYNDIKNLIHELGHIVNYYFSMQKQPFFYEDSTIFVSEIASIVNEILLNRYLLKTASSKEEKIFYLSKEIENYITTVFKQTMYTELEEKWYNTKTQESLTVKTLSDTYFNMLKKYYGSNIIYEDITNIEWTRLGHLYRFCYYPYKYATGLLMASTVVTSLLYNHTLKKEEYITFLSSGSSNYSLELIKILHLDFKDSNIINQGFEILKKDIEELKELIKE